MTRLMDSRSTALSAFDVDVRAAMTAVELRSLARRFVRQRVPLRSTKPSEEPVYLWKGTMRISPLDVLYQATRLLEI